MRDEIRRFIRDLPMNIAWLIPRKIAYWCFIRVAAHASTGKYGNEHPDLPVFTVLKRWDEA